MICFGENNIYYRNIIEEAFEYLKTKDEGGDTLKCFILCYKLLKKYEILDVIDLENAKKLLTERINNEICKDTSKYGVEYVSLPSDFFTHYDNNEFINEDIKKLISAELDILDKLQKEDGGFDISWQWYNSYSEFEEARKMWRPRITIDKLLFVKNHENK